MRGRRSGGSRDLRTWLAGVDPGLTRLRLASIAVTAMILAVALTAAVRALLDPAEPVTVLLFAGVLAMVSNLAVNEPDLPRRRVTTALMILPAKRPPKLSPQKLARDPAIVLMAPRPQEREALHRLPIPPLLPQSQHPMIPSPAPT